jgi:NAD(P)H-hydrate epimerase
MLPPDAYSAAAVRDHERHAMVAGTTGYTLMQRAGAAALACLRQRWPQARVVTVVAGTGNNGGDGLVVARLARAAGLDARALLVGDPSSIRGEAAEALRDLQAAGINVRPFDAAALAECDVIVDALLGIGARAPLLADWRAAIDAMNAAGTDIFSLDLPSGLDPDTGRALPAVKATATVTFLALKQGLFLGDGPDCAGALVFDALQTSPLPSLTPLFKRLDAQCLQAALAPRPRQSHKGRFGRVLVIGGGIGMPGAVRLAGESALRVGAGLVTVASRPEHLAVLVSARPELMFLSVEKGADLAPAMAQAEVIVIGPGLGCSHWARDLLQTVLASARADQRLVLDADALNLVAETPGLHRHDWILTPHPGEAARLLGNSSDAVQTDRVAALAELTRTRGGIAVLKGASTLVGRQGEVPRLCTHGNPGMSVPGMGDVLTGAIAGLLAQQGDSFAATCAAVYAHALAGDQCAHQGIRGMFALEVSAQLRAVLSRLP